MSIVSGMGDTDGSRPEGSILDLVRCSIFFFFSTPPHSLRGRCYGKRGQVSGWRRLHEAIGSRDPQCGKTFAATRGTVDAHHDLRKAKQRAEWRGRVAGPRFKPVAMHGDLQWWDQLSMPPDPAALVERVVKDLLRREFQFGACQTTT